MIRAHRQTAREDDPVHRVAMASIVIVIIIIIVVAVIAGAAYLLSSGAGRSNPSTSGLTSSSSGSTVTSQSSSQASATSSGLASSSVASGTKMYNGTFTYVNPLGPFGINDASGTPVEWNSTQSASGTFTFSLNPSTYIGTGSGQGTITVKTMGYCTGTATVPYTFSIQVAAPPGENMIISFNNPNPSNVTVQLSCQGSTTAFNQSNNPISFLSVYPNGVSISSVPTAVSQPLTAGISYNVTITQSSG